MEPTLILCPNRWLDNCSYVQGDDVEIVNMANGHQTGEEAVASKRFKLGMGTHEEHMVATITDLRNGHDVVLGIPWLERHQPSIGWQTRELALICAGRRHLVQGTRLTACDVSTKKSTINMISMQ